MIIRYDGATGEVEVIFNGAARKGIAPCALIFPKGVVVTAKKTEISMQFDFWNDEGIDWQ